MYDEELTLGQWIGTIVISMIPCVGLIFMLIWAFGSNTQIDKKRWAQAQLIMALIIIVITIILYAVLGAAFLQHFHH
mgnify:CR=1 FL=1